MNTVQMQQELLELFMLVGPTMEASERLTAQCVLASDTLKPVAVRVVNYESEVVYEVDAQELRLQYIAHTMYVNSFKDKTLKRIHSGT